MSGYSGPGRGVLYDPAGNVVSSELANADSVVAANTRGLATNAFQMVFNGTTWDRQRGTEDRLLLAAAARTASTFSAVQTNHNFRGAAFLLSVNGVPGVSTCQLQVRWWVSVYGGAAFNVAVCPARVAGGNDILVIYPGAATIFAGGSPVTYQTILPRYFDVGVVHAGAGSFDYAVECSLIP